VRLWLLTNGLGEDRAAALVAREIRLRRPALELIAAPLVTTGAEFANHGIPCALSGALPRSGGFPAASLLALLRDLPRVPAYVSYVRRLRRLRRPDDAFVACGDVFLLGLGRIAFGRAGAHLALPKSVYGQPHSALERALLRPWATIVLARDQATADALHARGVRAAFVGNPLVDGFPASVPAPPGPPRVLLLPGSRTEAPDNLVRLLDLVLLVRHPARWQCAWPRGIAVDEADRAASAAGWTRDGDTLRRGAAAVVVCAQQEGRTFESLLSEADLVVGLAGTANEQAAALGKPVVTLVGCGPQTTARRMAEQERLLGGAAQFVRGSRRAVASAIEALLASPEERARRGALGVTRTGPPGGAARVAERLLSDLGC
jgi:uncharacterized protein (TIGR03492 family)